MFKVISALLLATPFLYTSTAETINSEHAIDTFLSDSSPHLAAALDKINNDPSTKWSLTADYPSAEQTCEKIRDALSHKKYEALADLTHKWVISGYTNEAMPFSGIYLGQQGLMSLGHRMRHTATSTSKDIKIAGVDNARDTCVLRIKSSGKFKKSGKEFKDLVLYAGIRFHLGKALLVGLFDGHTSQQAIKLYREGTSEGIVHHFAKTVYRDGYDSEKTQKLLHNDVKFAFSAIGHRPVVYKGKKEFAKFGHFMRGVRKGLRTLPISLPLLAPKNKFCRTINTGDNNVVDMCFFTNVMTRSGVLHKAIRAQRAVIIDPSTKTVKGVFVHILSNIRMSDIIKDDDRDEHHHHDHHHHEDDELAQEDIEDLMFGEIEDDFDEEEYEEEKSPETFFNVIEVPERF